MFPIKNSLKQGNVLSPLLSNFDLEYTIRRAEVNQDGLKLEGTHQFPVYADAISKLGGSVHTIKINRLVAAGLEINAGKTKYMVMSRVQNARQNYNITTHNKTSERSEHLKY
jgi:hypothetical protein